MILKKHITLVFLLLVVGVMGQSRKSKGDDYFFSYAYQDAVNAYEKDLSKGFALGPSQYLNLAESYFKLNAYDKATEIYLQLYAKDSILENDHLNKLLLGLSKTADRGKMQAFLEKEDLSFQEELLKNAAFNTQLLTDNSALENALEFKVFNLNSNSPNSDFAPSFYKSKLLFSSGRASDKRKNYEPMGEAYLNIFSGEVNQEGQVDMVTPLREIQNSEYHKATPYYTEELNSILFVLSNTFEGELEFDENGKNALAIGIQKLDGTFNFLWRDLSTSFYYPFYDSSNGRLYFAANFDKGYGGTDIYYVNTNRGQIMSAPINLGPTINSPGNEIAPYIFDNALYFSSDIFYGLGGMDVYKANFKNEDFTIPVNLGSPINSEEDDFAFILKDYKEGLLGYFSSNRPGGKGKDDIYGFIVDQKPGLRTFAVNGRVVTLGNLEAVEQAQVRIYGADGSLLLETITNERGDFNLEIPWEPGVRIEATKNKYSVFSVYYNEEQMDAAQTSLMNIGIASYDNMVEEKEGQTVVKLKKFFFGKGRSSLSSEITTELDKVVDFVERFPGVQLRVETHTDSRGGSSTNFRLTQQRSDAIKKYLIEKGVPASSILYSVGYGEEKILNNCTNGVYCLELLHKQNQRSLIVVLNDNILFE